MIKTEFIISLLSFIAIVLFGIGVSFHIHYRKERWELSKRIKRMSGGVIRSEEITHFLYRLKDQVMTLVGSLGNLPVFKGKRDRSSLEKRFVKAGYRTENVSVIFSGVQVILAVLFFGMFSLMKLSFFKNLPSFHFILFSFVLIAVGFYLPILWLKWRIAKRKEEILKGFPDALDLMVVCLEVGTGLDAAVSRVGEEIRLSHRVLSDEFKLLSLELRAGKQRRDALRNLALRTDLEDVSALVSLLIQTDKFGTSVAQALRVHSDSMRIRRYQRAEEVATKLPVKLLFPLVLFIFPSLFVILLGPAVIQICRILLPRMAGH